VDELRARGGGRAGRLSPVGDPLSRPPMMEGRKIFTEGVSLQGGSQRHSDLRPTEAAGRRGECDLDGC